MQLQPFLHVHRGAKVFGVFHVQWGADGLLNFSIFTPGWRPGVRFPCTAEPHLSLFI
jgi:hypothetical protein